MVELVVTTDTQNQPQPHDLLRVGSNNLEKKIFKSFKTTLNKSRGLWLILHLPCDCQLNLNHNINHNHNNNDDSSDRNNLTMTTTITPIGGKPPPWGFFSNFFYSLLIFCFSYDYYLNHLNGRMTTTMMATTTTHQPLYPTPKPLNTSKW